MAINDDLVYVRTSARYAKGKIALTIPGVGGWKSTAALILTTKIAPNARFSHRERAYIVSVHQADRFEQAIADLRIKREAEG